MKAELLVTVVPLAALIIVVALLIRSSRKSRAQIDIDQRDTPNLPFPRHLDHSPTSIKVSHISQEDQDRLVVDAYRQWKNAFILRDAEPGRSFLRWGVVKQWLRYHITATSEGQGYALLCNVMMAGSEPDVQGTFDRLFSFCKAHPSQANEHLMSWQVTTDRYPSQKLGSSSQGDMLIAYALLLADRQWGSAGKINYREEASAVITALKQGCLDLENDTVLPGNWVGEMQPADQQPVPSACISPAIFTAFHQASKDPIWKKVSTRMMGLVKHFQNADTGSVTLMPDLIDGANPQGTDEDEELSSENMSVIFHLALAGLLNGNEEAIGYLSGFTCMMLAQSAGDLGEDPGDPALQSFCLMAAAVGKTTQDWLNRLWDLVAGQELDRQDPFGSTMRLITLILVSQNWMDPERKN